MELLLGTNQVTDRGVQRLVQAFDSNANDANGVKVLNFTSGLAQRRSRALRKPLGKWLDREEEVQVDVVVEFSVKIQNPDST